MQIIVLANAVQKAELATNDIPGIVWVQDESAFLQYPDADAYVDLEYTYSPERNALLRQLLPAPVVINSVVHTLHETDPLFIRINGWATFLSSPVTETACSEEVKPKLREVFSFLGKTPEWLPDEPGFVTARVVSMMINEAYLALGESVSTKDEINTAMRLGTNYPYGPFEWAEKIGVQNVVRLLTTLSQLHPRYTPAPLLAQEAIS